MTNSVFIGLSRRRALEQQMDVVANNLANMNTPAFKSERLIFREFLVPSQGKSAAYSYVQDVGTARDISDGPIQMTGNPLDVAINGNGHFVVDTPEGERYTRHGRFQLNEEGTLVNSVGDPVLTDAGPIAIPPGQIDITIAADGTISTSEGILGALRVVDFEDPQALRRGADGLYSTPDENPPQDVEDPKLVQGGMEQSNVQAVEQLTQMIRISRSHSTARNFLDQEDKREREMLDKIGRPA